MRYAFIRVKGSVPGNFGPPPQPALLDQVGCEYRPHVVGVMIGQKLVIRNSDATGHNVHALPDPRIGNPGFNEAQPVKGMLYGTAFTKEESNLFVKCDVHNWMGAYVHVVPHPFFFVSDVEGRFEVRGLPPGNYTLEAIHENSKIPTVEFQVEVKADTSTRADVTMKRQ